ncbi:hypothetical protein FXO37_34040 [Capsicum annuum]|nr:hypothetical protein FXO37_34040 [Capsicum annuum]
MWKEKLQEKRRQSLLFHEQLDSRGNDVMMMPDEFRGCVDVMMMPGEFGGCVDVMMIPGESGGYVDIIMMPGEFVGYIDVVMMPDEFERGKDVMMILCLTRVLVAVVKSTLGHVDHQEIGVHVGRFHQCNPLHLLWVMSLALSAYTTLVFVEPKLTAEIRNLVMKIDGGTYISVTLRWSQKLLYCIGQFTLSILYSFPEYVTPVGKKITKKENIKFNFNCGSGFEVSSKAINHPLKELDNEDEDGKSGLFYDANVFNWSSSDIVITYKTSFIHRDLKPSNILLSDDMRAKVADFGLVKNAPDGKYSVETWLAGTFDYLVPEYAATGRVTTKVDVYAFRVVLMEILTGRKALDETLPDERSHLISRLRRVLVNKDNLRKAIDPTLNPD